MINVTLFHWFAPWYALVALLCLFLSKRLWRSQTNADSNKVLAIWSVLLAIDLLAQVALVIGLHQYAPRLYAIFPGFDALYGPLLLLYVARLTHLPRWPGDWVVLALLTTPFFVALIRGLSWAWGISSAQYLSELTLYLQGTTDWHNTGVDLILFGQPVLCTLVAFAVLVFYRQRLQGQYSALHPHRLTWLTYLMLGHLIMWLAVALLLQHATQLAPHPMASQWVFVSYTPPIIWLLALIYMGIHQAPVPRVTYAKQTDVRQPSGSDHPIIEALAKNQWYLICQLSLTELAEKLHYSPYELSRILNDELNQSFYDLINGYRVEHAKRLLSDPSQKNQPLVSIAKASGFHSEGSFNQHFKAHTGLAPSRYRGGH